METISFEEFKSQVTEDMEVASLKIDVPSNDVSEYERAVDEWNCCNEILCNIECFEEEARITAMCNSEINGYAELGFFG